MDASEARRTLERLKRGVPPTSSIDDLSVGMKPLQSKLDALLASTANPRWFFVQSEYGEGKSHFHSFAKDHALKAGYAVASLDVNSDDGALHQPQRHLSIVLRSLRSPLPEFHEYQGFAEIVRHWLESSERENAVRILERVQAVEPWLPAGYDPTNLWSWTRWLIGSDDDNWSNGWFYPNLINFFSGEDLANKSAQARFHASYRFQIVQQWLVETGHKGLLLFVDEVDNVVRQIHGKGHAACFRTLAWYCSCSAFPNVRVIFASTPEVIQMLDGWGRNSYLSNLRGQVTVREEEVRVFERWNREARRLSGEGWQTCPRLTPNQRKRLFQKVVALHESAWDWCWNDRNGTLEELAADRRFQSPRRWVRASVQLLDTLQQSVDARAECRTRPIVAVDSHFSNRNDAVVTSISADKQFAEPVRT